MEREVIQSVGFRNIVENGEVTGFQLKIRLPYYRGVFLSQLRPGTLTVDGEVFTKEQITWCIRGEEYTPDGCAQGEKGRRAFPGLSRFEVWILLYLKLYAACHAGRPGPGQGELCVHAGVRPPCERAETYHCLSLDKTERGGETLLFLMLIYPNYQTAP